MSLPSQQDMYDEHDGTFAIIYQVHDYAANPRLSLTNWGMILCLCYYHLHLCFENGNTDQERWISVECLNLTPFQLLSDLLDRAFFPAGSTKQCTIIWCKDLAPGNVGVTVDDSDRNITIKIDVRQSRAWDIIITILHEIAHALLRQHCCKGSCGQQSCQRVWFKMEGYIGHAYYWHAMAWAVEDIAAYYVGGLPDMYRVQDALNELRASGSIPTDAYIDTVLRPWQAALFRAHVAHRLRTYNMNRLLR